MAARENIFMENLPGSALKFRNFTGAEQKYNPKGSRTFNIEIDDINFAERLDKDGWNIKWDTKEHDNGEHYLPTLPVQVKFGDYPPRIMMEQAGNKVWLNEDTVGDLDNMEILEVKAIEIRPYNYDVNGKTGVKAYLSKLRVEVARDMFCD